MKTGVGQRIELTLMFVAVLCAVVITALTIRNTIHPKAVNPPPMPQSSTVKDWERYGSVGHRLGPATAAVTIVEFSDFECPFCKKFATGALPYVRRHHPNDVAVVFRQWPLPGHPMAYPAARASECAADQGRFQQFHDIVFPLQDSLGLIPFAELAIRSGVQDTSRFLKCFHEAGKVASIEADSKAAIELGGQGTPTVLVNDILLHGAPDSVRLDSLVVAQLAKRGHQ